MYKNKNNDTIDDNSDVQNKRVISMSAMKGLQMFKYISLGTTFVEVFRRMYEVRCM